MSTYPNKNLSIIVPVFNESESLPELHSKILDVLSNVPYKYEIIYIDDGSIDDTFKTLKSLKLAKIIRHSRNFGQTAALSTGIQKAKGDIIITIDADLENDPEEIPKLLTKLNEGYDVVSGWRKTRWQKNFFTRKIPSIIANKLISRITKIKIHDHGCTLKAYRKHIFEGVKFTGDAHRMIVGFALTSRAKITEIPINYHPRLYGKSKYSMGRIFSVLLDIVLFHFFFKYGHKPMHFFGKFGLINIALSIITFLAAIYLKFFQSTNLNRTPLVLLTTLFFVIGINFILLGIIAELIILKDKNFYIKEEEENN